jgi:hypothetical protein
MFVACQPKLRRIYLEDFSTTSTCLYVVNASDEAALYCIIMNRDLFMSTSQE